MNQNLVLNKHKVISSKEKGLTKTVNKYGAIYFYNKNGNLHNPAGPARIYTNGNEYWYKDGLLHREDGPAITYQYAGIKVKRFFIENKEVKESDLACNKILSSKADKKSDKSDPLSIPYSPGTNKSVVERDKSTTIYVKNPEGQLHNEAGPALVMTTPLGTFSGWYINGKKHREDGPGTQYISTEKQSYSYFLNDKQVAKSDLNLPNDLD